MSFPFFETRNSTLSFIYPTVSQSLDDTRRGLRKHWQPGRKRDLSRSPELFTFRPSYNGRRVRIKTVRQLNNGAQYVTKDLIS